MLGPAVDGTERGGYGARVVRLRGSLSQVGRVRGSGINVGQRASCSSENTVHFMRLIIIATASMFHSYPRHRRARARAARRMRRTRLMSLMRLSVWRSMPRPSKLVEQHFGLCTKISASWRDDRPRIDRRRHGGGSDALLWGGRHRLEVPVTTTAPRGRMAE